MEAGGPRASRELPAQSTKLTAIMFADMVSYSKHIEKDEAANASNAERSIELFKALIGDYGGRIANIIGDGILALFDSADGGSPIRHSRFRRSFSTSLYGMTATRITVSYRS